MPHQNDQKYDPYNNVDGNIYSDKREKSGCTVGESLCNGITTLFYAAFRKRNSSYEPIPSEAKATSTGTTTSEEASNNSFKQSK